MAGCGRYENIAENRRGGGETAAAAKKHRKHRCTARNIKHLADVFNVKMKTKIEKMASDTVLETISTSLCNDSLTL